MSNKLKYLNQLSKDEIKSLIVNKSNLGTYINSTIINLDGDEVLIISATNKNVGECGTTYYIYNDYQLLSIATKHSLSEPPKFNLPISNLTNPNERNKTRTLLKTLTAKFINQGYPEDATTYYNSFTPIFERLNDENMLIISDIARHQFLGNLEQAAEYVKENATNLGYKNFYRIQSISNRLIEHILTYQRNAKENTSNDDQSGDGQKN